MSMVIPDAIEPVVGWRCFEINDGLLISPQQRMPWPPARAARATCGNARWHQEWVEATPEELILMEAEARVDGFKAETGQYVRYLMPDGAIEQRGVYMPWGMRGSAPAVPHYPAEGKEWVLRMSVRGHPAPDEGCHCGIHLARNLGTALPYAPGDRSRGAFGLVKGWGKVIPASGGFRVEFAYPDRLYLYAEPHEDLYAYGVPLAPVLECEEFLPQIGVTWR